MVSLLAAGAAVGLLAAHRADQILERVGGVDPERSALEGAVRNGAGSAAAATIDQRVVDLGREHVRAESSYPTVSVLLRPKVELAPLDRRSPRPHAAISLSGDDPEPLEPSEHGMRDALTEMPACGRYEKNSSKAYWSGRCHTSAIRPSRTSSRIAGLTGGCVMHR